MQTLTKGQARTGKIVTDGITLGGTAITATAAELNAGSGAGVTAGVVTASKGVVVDANKDIGDFRNLDAVNIDAGASGTAGSVDIFPATASKGKLAITKADNTNNDTTTLTVDLHGQATTVHLPDGGAATTYLVQSTAALTLAEANFLDGATAGTQVASKAVIADANVNTGVSKVTQLHIGASGSEVQVNATPAELNAWCDQSAGLQAVTGAVAITADGTKNRASIDSGGAYAITLAVPGAAAVGRFLCIEYSQGTTDAVTLANTNMVSGSAGTTYTLNADGEGLLLYGAEAKWVVVKEFGGITIA